MDFLNKAKESLTMAGKEITQKASDMSGIARANLQLREDEKKLREAFRKLGEQFFEEHPEEATRLFPEQVHDIRSAYEAIEGDKKELISLKGMRICPNCGAEQEQGTSTCKVCGINMDEVEDTSKEESIAYCPDCGHETVAGARFCMNCGAKL